MTITPHLLAGSAIATATTTSYPLAFLVGFLSHFIIDAIPHVDPGTFFYPDDAAKKQTESWPTWIYIFAATEFIIIGTIFIILFQNKPNFGIMVMGGLGGIGVDIIDNNPSRFLRKWPIIKQILWLHHLVHYDLSNHRWYWGFVPQIIIIGASLWYLLRS